jgi:hypothetical protein
MRNAAWGMGKGLDGREAARLAAQQALNHLGTVKPGLGLVFISQEFAFGPVMAGLASILGNVPLWGISTSRPLTSEGEHSRAVVVGLVGGPNLNAKVSFWPHFAQDSEGTARQMLQALYPEAEQARGLLLGADGVSGNITEICASLTGTRVPVAGCMAAGEALQGRTYQLGGNQWGSGGLTCAVLEGSGVIGMAAGHGWADTGAFFNITRARDVWVYGMDDTPAAEVYSRFLGSPAREWAFPPLRELARLYPLGIEMTPGSSDLMIRSPLHIEVDGSLRMNIPVAEGQVARLMIGNQEACLAAARQAGREALKSLSGARPMLGMILVDQAWQYLFQAEPARFVNEVRQELGDIPLVGGYTLGQIIRPRAEGYVRVYNQMILVVVIGEK